MMVRAILAAAAVVCLLATRFLPDQATIMTVLAAIAMLAVVVSLVVPAPKPPPEVILKLREAHGFSASDVSSRSHLTATLYREVSEGNAGAVPLLITAGADVNIQAGDARATPLHVALTNGDIAMVDVLLECCCALDVPIFNGKTGMHLVAMAGNATLAGKLLAAGARADLADREDDCTPLMLAAAYGNNKDAGARVIELLIASGVNLEACDKKNMTALDYALAANYTPAIAKLQRAGATTLKVRGGSTKKDSKRL